MFWQFRGNKRAPVQPPALAALSASIVRSSRVVVQENWAKLKISQLNPSGGPLEPAGSALHSAQHSEYSHPGHAHHKVRFVFTGLGLILAPEKRTNQTHPHVCRARTRAPSREGSVRCSCRCHRQLCGHLLFIGIFPCFLQQNFHPLCSLVASASLFGPEPQFLAPVLTPFSREGKTCAVGKAHKKYGWLLFSCLRAKIFKRAFFSCLFVRQSR